MFTAENLIVAVVVFILVFVVLALAVVPYAGLIALAAGLISFGLKGGKVLSYGRRTY